MMDFGKGQKPIGYRPPELIDKVIKELIEVSGHSPATIVGMLVEAQLKQMDLFSIPGENLEPLENFKNLVDLKRSKKKVKKSQR